MRNLLEKRYQHCKIKECIKEYTEAIRYFEDPSEGCVCEVADSAYDEDRHFTLHNPTQRSVNLIAIDKCLIGQGPRMPKRCDCAFYADKEITFVEFKLRQPGKERDADQRQDKRLKEAAEQLRASILSFESEGFIDESHTVRAYAHVGFQPLIPAPVTTLTNLESYINEDTKALVEFTATNEASF